MSTKPLAATQLSGLVRHAQTVAPAEIAGAKHELARSIHDNLSGAIDEAARHAQSGEALHPGLVRDLVAEAIRRGVVDLPELGLGRLDDVMGALDAVMDPKRLAAQLEAAAGVASARLRPERLRIPVPQQAIAIVDQDDNLWSTLQGGYFIRKGVSPLPGTDGSRPEHFRAEDRLGPITTADFRQRRLEMLDPGFPFAARPGATTWPVQPDPDGRRNIALEAVLDMLEKAQRAGAEWRGPTLGLVQRQLSHPATAQDVLVETSREQRPEEVQAIYRLMKDLGVFTEALHPDQVATISSPEYKVRLKKSGTSGPSVDNPAFAKLAAMEERFDRAQRAPLLPEALPVIPGDGNLAARTPLHVARFSDDDVGAIDAKGQLQPGTVVHVIRGLLDELSVSPQRWSNLKIIVEATIPKESLIDLERAFSDQRMRPDLWSAPSRWEPESQRDGRVRRVVVGVDSEGRAGVRPMLLEEVAEYERLLANNVSFARRT